MKLTSCQCISLTRPRVGATSWTATARSGPLRAPPSRFTSRRQFGIISPILDAVYVCFDSVHAFTGLPWFWSIPLTAVIFRLVIDSPLRKINQKYRAESTRIGALLRLRSKRDADAAKQTVSRLPANQQREAWARQSQKSAEGIKESLIELRREAGSKPWHQYAILFGIPPLMIQAETVREMSGSGFGLLKGIEAWFQTKSAAGLEDAYIDPASVEASSDAASQPALHVDSLADIEATTVETVSGTASQSALHVPSLADSGFSLIPDLLAADPTNSLSIGFFFAILAQIMFRNYKRRFAALPKGNLDRAADGVQFGIGFLAPVALATAPAALPLFLFSSSCTSLLINVFWHIVMPVHPVPSIEELEKVESSLKQRNGPTATFPTRKLARKTQSGLAATSRRLPKRK